MNIPDIQNLHATKYRTGMRQKMHTSNYPYDFLWQHKNRLQAWLLDSSDHTLSYCTVGGKQMYSINFIKAFSEEVPSPYKKYQ